MRWHDGIVAGFRAVAVTVWTVIAAGGGVMPVAVARMPEASSPGEIDQSRRQASAAEPENVPSPTAAVRPRPRATMTAPRRDDPLVRGALGQVRVGSRRLSYDDVVAEAGNDRRLEEYRERRRDAEPTPVGQLELAAWCRGRKLVEQERVHLLAVVSLDPDHVAARVGLGHRRVDGRWVDPRAVAEAVEAERRFQATVREHAGELRGLARRLGRGETSPEEAATRIGEWCDPIGIAVLEACFSGVNEASAACVVEALGRRGGGAVDESLVRHALSSPWPGVRNAAAAALRSRDRSGWLPLLLEAFEGPATSEIGWRKEPDGTLVGRVVVDAEGTDRRRITVQDHVVTVAGDAARAGDEALLQAALLTLAADEGRSAGNRRVAAGTAAIAGLLRATTDVSIGDDPDGWRAWWSEETGTPLPEDKPVVTSSISSWSSTRGEPAAALVRAERAERARRASECLAAGTVVCTQSGPVEVDRLRPGDVVLTQDSTSGTLGLRPVLATTVRPAARTLSVRCAGETIRATVEHPFRCVDRGWVVARDLRPGDRLVALGGVAAVESIEEEAIPVRAFNLVVDGDHTYFCGPAKLLSRDITRERAVSARKD